jgi:DNA modification methylase
MEATILVGDVLQRLSDIPDGSVQCCVTSPPYWGLRDYGQEGQLGLESTPELYVKNMVAVFREVRRVLADDGVCWLNLGDSYFPHNGSRGNKNQAGDSLRGRNNDYQPAPKLQPGETSIKPKDLVGIPWRVAFALQADGWWLRQDIIWHKPNPMPESVTDRCTKSHEYLFMLTKSSRYYFDSGAIKEPSAGLGKTTIRFGGAKYGDSDDPMHATKSGNEYIDTGFRNKRSVWTIATKPFKGAHFAVMPEALCEPPILASSRPGDLVLDPFTGSGTVAVVALRHGRNFIGTELNPEYAEIAKTRISNANSLMNEVTIK